jgi:uncharacterized protein (TIGR01777 family)
VKVVIAGGTGFLGGPLVERLLARADVVVLTRDPSKVKRGRGVAWDAKTVGAWADEVASADVVINLAGAGIGDQRWSAERKRELKRSRLDATQAVVSALQRTPSRNRLLLNASAIGIYGDRGDEILDESSSAGAGFLADLAVEWEAAAREAEGSARVGILRFGIILATDGGALGKMIPPFRLFAGGVFGDGRQWMSWIDRRDVLSAVQALADDPACEGTYNLVAPKPVTNRQFTDALGRELGRPTVARAPGFALRMALGEMAGPLLLDSARVLPRRLEERGFTFEFPTLDRSLAALLA